LVVIIAEAKIVDNSKIIVATARIEVEVTKACWFGSFIGHILLPPFGIIFL